MVDTPVDEVEQSLSVDTFTNGRWNDLCIDLGAGNLGIRDTETETCSVVIL